MYVAPEHGEEAFTSPHCEVYTSQSWENLYVRGRPPARMPGGGSPFADTPISRSICFHCGEHCYWYDEDMLYPANVNVPMPSPDLPDDLKPDYMEAREIFNSSPRGAAALLRLVIQKLMKALGEPGKDINTEIGELVQKRKISARTQKMLDSVRVIGNEAVHPGTLDVRDDRTLAGALFSLVNLIMVEAVSYDKYVDSVYQKLPESKLKGIETRHRLKPDKGGSRGRD
jgi:hypothetical protein